MRPRIVQSDGQIGFFWATAAGRRTSLQSLVEADDEPDRLVATHLEALDDALIIAAERFGEILGGEGVPRMPTSVTIWSICTALWTGCASSTPRPPKRPD